MNKNTAIGLGIAIAGALGLVIYAVNKNSNNGTSTGGDETNQDQSLPTDIKVGDKLYPSGAYVNIRSNAVVDEEESKWYNTDNFVAEKFTGFIGTVIQVLRGEDGFTWYKVKLAKPIDKYGWGTGDWTEGYVRRDAIKKG